MSDPEFTAIRTFLTIIDAEVAKTALESAGIPAFIRADDCGGMRPHLWMSGVKLFVRSEDVEQAEEFLSAPVTSDPEAGNDSGETDL